MLTDRLPGLSKPAEKKTTSRRVKLPWRRKPRAPIQRTAADKLAARIARQKKKTDVQTEVDAIRKAIMEGAERMALRFPGHGAKYYYRQIIQASNPKPTTPRKITPWNAFVSKELKKLNDGESYLLIDIGLHS